MKQFTINENDAGQRLDKYLSKSIPLLPQALLYKYIRLKRVKVNGGRAAQGQKLHRGDRVELYINDEFFETAQDSAYKVLRPSFDIVYEDAHILLIDKKQGVLVHEDETGAPDTLINQIKAHLYRTGQWDEGRERSFAPALCNRIDRNTSGMVIAAKTAAALRILNQKIKDREIDKYYLCLCFGTFMQKKGTLKHYISRDLQNKQVTVHDKPVRGALTAETEWKLLKSKDGLSLLQCRLLTGRTHQIRAQLAHIGHPVCGDTKYGTARQNAGLPFRHQALHAYKLTFAFKTDAGELAYLAGKTFETREAPFLEYFETEMGTRAGR